MSYTITPTNTPGRPFPWSAELSDSETDLSNVTARGTSATGALQNLIDTYALTVEVGK